ncbi:MAG: hypothetical protein CMP05_11840 [Xanthomarina sp.]|uniref:hypothetical protein n=1 Tax=Flavobacteriaceae TaxID=49546 RepID=UPI000C5C4EA8|nr:MULTISPECIES: hypothetical protein [Flavobacteriaceae]MAL22157.1 hypothetical protein [Xanthomarina sp.]MBF62673.1 hypothetical protein [Xanthomarina sp.]|tara:strand:- start:429 stop:776 length:348 start_codon:yes stop_codon:yes gene_type:complete
MVTIKNYKTITKDDGEKFYALILEGGIEPVLSQKTGRTYFTVRNATVPTTFGEQTCKSAIGTQFPGVIKRIECDPYKYTIQDTEETIELSHKWEYVDENLQVLKDHVVKDTKKIK